MSHSLRHLLSNMSLLFRQSATDLFAIIITYLHDSILMQKIHSKVQICQVLFTDITNSVVFSIIQAKTSIVYYYLISQIKSCDVKNAIYFQFMISFLYNWLLVLYSLLLGEGHGKMRILCLTKFYSTEI